MRPTHSAILFVQYKATCDVQVVTFVPGGTLGWCTMRDIARVFAVRTRAAVAHSNEAATVQVKPFLPTNPNAMTVGHQATLKNDHGHTIMTHWVSHTVYKDSHLSAR